MAETDRHHAGRVGASASIGLLIALAVVAPRAAAVPGDGPIVFESDRGGQSDLWVMAADGSNAINLTNDKIDDVFPAWSHDGKKIIWTRGGRGPAGELWVMNADGSGRRQLTFNAFSDFNADFSPDGSEIVFRSFRDGNRDIYVIRADGTNERRLTTDPAIDFAPDWSPDGTRIVFSSTRSGTYAVYTMNPDGSDVRKLTDDWRNASIPKWSPDGATILFSDGFCDSCGESDLFVMNADGTGVIQVTDSPGNELGAAWSRDGKKILSDFSTLTPSERHLAKGDIVVVEVATGATTNLTRTTGINEGSPDWSNGGRPPNEASASPADHQTPPEGVRVQIANDPARQGATIVYAVPRPGHVELRIYDVTGRELAHIADRWQPAGTHEAPFPAAARSQIYLYRLDWEGGTTSGKCAVVR